MNDYELSKFLEDFLEKTKTDNYKTFIENLETIRSNIEIAIMTIKLGDVDAGLFGLDASLREFHYAIDTAKALSMCTQKLLAVLDKQNELLFNNSTREEIIDALKIFRDKSSIDTNGDLRISKDDSRKIFRILNKLSISD